MSRSLAGQEITANPFFSLSGFHPWTWIPPFPGGMTANERLLMHSPGSDE